MSLSPPSATFFDFDGVAKYAHGKERVNPFLNPAAIKALYF